LAEAGDNRSGVIASWWKQWPYAEVGWSLPPRIAILDLDLKPQRNGYRDFERLTGVPVDKFMTPQASTPSGGRHVMCSTQGKQYLNAVSIAGTGIDLKTQIGFIVMPGCRNGRHWISGKPNRPAPIPREIVALLKERSRSVNVNAPPSSRDHVALAPSGCPPEGILGAPEGCMSRYGRAALLSICEAIQRAPNGGQEIALNNGSLKIGMLVRARELPPSAMEAVRAAARAMPSYDPRRPWTRELIEKKVARALADALRKEIRT
jgi:hypothetical protein